MLWVLICVVLVIGLAYWFTKYMVGRSGFGTISLEKRIDVLKILAQMPLGRDQRLLMIQAGQRYFLIGVTPAGMTALAEFTSEEAELWQVKEAQLVNGQAMSFTEAVKRVLKQKGQR